MVLPWALGCGCLQALAQASVEDVEIQDSGSVSPDMLARRIRTAVCEGGVHLFACTVKGLQFQSEGSLRPVSLPCCGFVVSDAGAKQVLRVDEKCPMCKTRLHRRQEREVREAPEMVKRAIQAEHMGQGPNRVNKTDVQLFTDDMLGRGGEAVVYKGIFEGEEVAVKCMSLPSLEWRALNSVRHVLGVSHVAGTFSRNICQMKGYFATETELG